MAAPGAGDPLNAKNGNAPFAQRIDPSREKLTPAQLQFMRQVQLAQWQKTLPQRRTRNIMTGLGIGALVLAICIRPGYTACGVREKGTRRVAFNVRVKWGSYLILLYAALTGLVITVG